MSTGESRCRPGRHVFPPFKESSDLGGGAQRCECGAVLIDRTLGGGRVVEIGTEYSVASDETRTRSASTPWGETFDDLASTGTVSSPGCAR